MDLADAKILVTGGAGFIGGRLVRRLLAAGARVTVVDDLSNSARENVPDAATFIQLALPHPHLGELVTDGRFDAIFHLAGPAYVPPSVEDPIGNLRNCAEVTLQLLEVVRRRAPETPVIYTSSAAVYGNPVRVPIAEDDPVRPVSPYGISKLAAEHYVTLYASLHAMRTASLRLFSVFGPGQSKQVVFDLIAKVRRNPDRIEVYGTGDEMRDFVFVEDVVSAALLVLGSGPLSGQVYNVASGEGTSIRELVGLVCRATGTSPHVAYTGEVRAGDALQWVADIQRIAALGFRPSVSMAEGVARAAAWFDGGRPPGGEPG